MSRPASMRAEAARIVVELCDTYGSAFEAPVWDVIERCAEVVGAEGSTEEMRRHAGVRALCRLVAAEAER